MTARETDRPTLAVDTQLPAVLRCYLLLPNSTPYLRILTACKKCMCTSQVRFLVYKAAELSLALQSCTLGTHHSAGLGSVLRQLEGHLDMALGAQVVDLIRFCQPAA